MATFLDKTGLGTFWAKIKSTFQTLGNLVTAWGSTPSDTKYPSEKLVKDEFERTVFEFTKIHKDNYYASNVCRLHTTNTPNQFVIWSGMKFVSSSYMPVIKIYGYAYGEQKIIDLKIGTYVYSNSFARYDAVCSGAWAPEIYLWKYTKDSVDYIAIGLKGSCYVLGFQVDVQIGANGSFLNIDLNGWTTSHNGSDTSVNLIPEVGTDKCVRVEYNSIASNISGNAATASAAKSGSALETALNGKASSSHTHGNVTNGGGLQTTDVTIGNGDKLVITDASDSNKIARASAAFDASTTSKALTKKGTFEDFQPPVTRANFWYWENTFLRGNYAGPGIAALHDAFNALDKRGYTITITRTRNGVNEDLSEYCSLLFKGHQENFNSLRCGGGTLKIEIEKPNGYISAAGSYPYGYFYLFFYSAWPESVTFRVYSNYSSQAEPGWKTLTTTKMSSGYGFFANNGFYNISKLEITIDATNKTTTDTIAPISLLFCATRPSIPEGFPVVKKYGPETLYYKLTAPEFNPTDKKANEYNMLGDVEDVDTTVDGDRKIALCNQSKSASNGVFRWLKLSNVWTWIKGLLSSESGVNISGNAATATKATQDSDGNAINATYFKSSGNTTLVAGAATKIGTQNGADVKLTLPAHQDVSGKMDTSASNATAPSSSGGDGATATLLNNLSDGTSDIVTTDNGDNVLIATTDNGGSVTNKWYKRKLVKLIPWIIKKLGSRLVYDCGAGSTSGDDFDAALAAFNAGQWVIIHKDNYVYYCVGTFQSSLRFRKLSNSATGISVSTLNWTRENEPTSLTQLDASLSGHTHTRSDITNFAHTHGNIQDSGALQTSDITIASGDKLVVTDSSDSSKVARASASFDGSTTTKALTQKGTFETFMTPSAGNAASGALQNLTGQLTEGTSDFTDNTEIFTSYAGNNGFAESGHVNQPYRRKASSMLNYVRDGYAIDRSPASVGTTHKRISLGYGKYSSSGVGAATYIVRLFFNYVDDGGLVGKGITVLVTYDFRFSSMQKSECRILSDNGVRDAGYNVVLANFISDSGDNGKLHICIGLVKNSAPTTLVAFNYSYCKIFKVSTIGDWTQDISSDAVGTYNYIVQATDLVSSAVNADMVDGKHIVIGSWAGASNTIYFG